MKHIYMIFTVLMVSLSLNAMKPDHQMDSYRELCKNYLKVDIFYTTVHCVPFVFREVRQNKPLVLFFSCLALLPGYQLRNSFRTYRLAQKGIIDYRS
jgi:hypothetical protein